MAPTRAANKITRNITTRSKAMQVMHSENINPDKLANKFSARTKRKADASPTKEKAFKRGAFNNVNVDLKNKVLTEAKGLKTNILRPLKEANSIKIVQKPKQNVNLAPPPPIPAVNKIVTRATIKHQVLKQGTNNTAMKPPVKKEDIQLAAVVTTKKRLSNEFEKSTNESLYRTALDDTSAKRSLSKLSAKESEVDRKSLSNLSFVTKEFELKLHFGNHNVPEGVVDFDKENWDDVYQVSHYAMDIFNYYKDMEGKYIIGDYMERQICLTKWMRSLLVDWMVEIQESFELNHETLYLGVKLVDLYLDRVVVSKDTLQLVGAAAMFVASKFDERIPPMIDDFLYICDGAYTRREMIRMEVSLVKVVDYNLGIPISYRFLRRYARCAKITMNVLTLARYILEFNLMEYETITTKDSLLASAALYLALKMKTFSDWTPTLEFYTGYKINDFKDVVIQLNRAISKPPRPQIMTVRNKYSHRIFFEVAKTPLLPECELF
ncbi:hypothetical protein ABEB36_012252 [Hypothenemus hampei]|uniref:G2/mitotic-specific cyclin-B3 n=1 Tax=Hypothenemus hampei TaxID=57062 RepID=A0ABD1EAK0_HYPHA